MFPPTTRSHPLIAIIEDDWSILELIRDLLLDEGYETTCCLNAQEAYRKTKQQSPDLIILDLHLDGSESGLTVLELLRLTPATAVLPIIVCSADTALLKEKACQLSRYNCEVIEKPFDLDALVEKVSNLVARTPQMCSLLALPHPHSERDSTHHQASALAITHQC